MKSIEKAICLALTFVVLISTAIAIAEHFKQETVERMKTPELQSAGNIDTSAIDENQTPEQFSGGASSTQTSLGLIEPMKPYNEGYKAGFEAGLKAGFDAGYETAYQDIIAYLIQKQGEVKTTNVRDQIRDRWWSNQGSQMSWFVSIGETA